MDLENRKIEVRLISVEDLIENKNFIIDLLEDNLNINFPNISNLSKYAINGYDDMLRFKKDNSAILIGAFDNEK